MAGTKDKAAQEKKHYSRKNQISANGITNFF